VTNALLCLRERMNDLSVTERRIAQYMLEKGEALLGTSIATVAKECETGKSSVVHLCKKIGFQGYKEFCNTLSAEQAVRRQETMDEFTDIHPNHTTEQICQIVLQSDVRSLKNTLDILDMAQMEQAVDALCDARQILFFGVGNSGIVAQDAQNKLRRIGMNAYFSPDSHCQLLSTMTLSREDVAFFFSYHGQTRDMIEAMVYAKERGAKVIAVTKFSKNDMDDLADIHLHVASSESLVRAGAMASRLSMLSLVDMLFTCIASKRHDEILSVLESTVKVAGKRRM